MVVSIVFVDGPMAKQRTHITARDVESLHGAIASVAMGREVLKYRLTQVADDTVVGRITDDSDESMQLLGDLDGFEPYRKVDESLRDVRRSLDAKCGVISTNDAASSRMTLAVCLLTALTLPVLILSILACFRAVGLL